VLHAQKVNKTNSELTGHLKILASTAQLLSSLVWLCLNLQYCILSQDLFSATNQISHYHQ